MEVSEVAAAAMGDNGNGCDSNRGGGDTGGDCDGSYSWGGDECDRCGHSNSYCMSTVSESSPS